MPRFVWRQLTRRKHLNARPSYHNIFILNSLPHKASFPVSPACRGEKGCAEISRVMIDLHPRGPPFWQNGMHRQAYRKPSHAAQPPAPSLDSPGPTGLIPLSGHWHPTAWAGCKPISRCKPRYQRQFVTSSRGSHSNTAYSKEWHPCQVFSP